MPSSSPEKKPEVPEKLKEVFMWYEGRPDMFRQEVTTEEIALFTELLNSDLSVQEIADKRTLLIDSDFYEEWETAVGERKEELDRLNTENWRKMAIYQAICELKRNKTL